jgi:hypothetical protein
MIKKLSGLFIALFIIGNLSAQSLYKADQRLSDCFSQEYIAQLENSNSELIPYYNYYLDNSYYIVDLKSVGKEVTGTDIHTVLAIDNSGVKNYFSETVYSKEKFNPLKYQFNLSSNSFITYVWKEAGIAVVFYPLSHISANFKKSLKK